MATAATYPLYLNGQRVKEGTVNISIHYYASPLVIGADTENGVVQFFFPDIIDDVRMYNRHFSAADVAELFGNLPERVTITNLRMDGTTATLSLENCTPGVTNEVLWANSLAAGVHWRSLTNIVSSAATCTISFSCRGSFQQCLLPNPKPSVVTGVY